MRKFKDEIIKDMERIITEKHLSRATMARLIGCDSSQVGRWLNGKARPTLTYQRLIRRGIKKVDNL